MENETLNTEPVLTARQKVEEQYTLYQENINKFDEKGTALAAVRARDALSELAKASKLARKEIQSAKVAKVAAKRASKVVA